MTGVFLVSPVLLLCLGLPIFFVLCAAVGLPMGSKAGCRWP